MEKKISIFQILEKFGKDAYLTASIIKAGEHAHIPASNSEYEYVITRTDRPSKWEYDVYLRPRRRLYPV